VDLSDKLLDDHDHTDDLLSDPEVIAVIQNHLMPIADTVHLDPDDVDGRQVLGSAIQIGHSRRACPRLFYVLKAQDLIYLVWPIWLACC
jgi:hypothetical protein